MMNAIKSSKLTVAVLLVLASYGAHAEGAAPSHPPHWAYDGQKADPAHWAKLDPSFEKCGAGQAQSPIDIHNAVKTALPKLDFQYGSAVPVIVNNGHTVQVNVPAGQKLKINDQSYELLQFHFHTPSEETVNGKHTAMVAHFVHRNAAGELGVVAVLINSGKKNAAFDGIFAHLPRPAEKVTVDELTLDMAALLPENKGYFSYEGSLTTPPCSQGVHWMVLKTPITLSADQIKTFQRVFNKNARPIQPLFDRVVKESL